MLDCKLPSLLSHGLHRFFPGNRNEAFCQKLRANDDAATLYAILTAKHDSRAA